ncbi:MAG TPA: hypothetical protein DDY58_16220 [Terrisporobacter glycolicus]|uniref:hypothetical protein n=1 Tax=Terrisporobacter TaxID=1505652 RepID=UPI000E960531|nr:MULTISPECIES: hypothetical protein [Terrisporobacter]HBI93838.1 hypothetical protein [Terrisporobacter hibernicus]
MNKSDLKDGMVVTIRGGNQCILSGDFLFRNNFTISSTILDYNEDLTSKKNKHSDIVKVFSVGKEKELWKREEVNWSKVPVGTKVLVSANEEDWFTSYFIKKLSPIEDASFYVINSEGKLSDWDYCKLAEEPKEEVTFDDIDKKLDFYCINHNKSCNQACGPCVTKNILENYNVTRKDNI